MKILYLDCNMGASGDMIMGALYELLGEEDRTSFLNTMNGLMPEKLRVQAVYEEKSGIAGTHMKVEIGGIDEGQRIYAYSGLKDEAGANYNNAHDRRDSCHSHNHTKDCHSHDYSNNKDKAVYGYEDHLQGSYHGHEDGGHNSHNYQHESHDHMHAHDHSYTHTHEHKHICEHAHKHGNKEHGDSDHTHGTLEEICGIIDSMPIDEEVKKNAVNIYKIIAEAEGKVHNRKVTDVHFHEVGTYDAIADVVGVCLIIKMLGVDKIIASPIRVGYGTVRCAHGILPVPAPATALILKGIPVYSGDIKSEMCTPTGAAIIKYFSKCFDVMPMMSMEGIGYGMGNKTFDKYPNCLRASMGYDIENSLDRIAELEANIDDMTGEEIGYAIDVIIEKGALDVFAEHITMKKSRPGIKFVCLCQEKDEDYFVSLIFKYTSTLGIRKKLCERYVLSRTVEKQKTPWGDIDVKVSKGYGVEKRKLEFEQLKEIAVKNDVSISDIKNKIKGK